MRDIKFRAWNTKYFRFLSQEDLTMTLDGVLLMDWDGSIFKSDEVIVEQYTGINDKNGIHIYEGDIVQQVRAYEDFPEIEPTKIGLPLVVNSGSYVYGKWIAREINKIGFGVNDYQFSKDLVVIGNIHENQELLEEQ